jgi:hypothetical protein
VPIDGKCYSRNDISKEMSNCKAGGTGCNCDIFFGGLSQTVGSGAGLTPSSPTFQNTLNLVAPVTVSKTSFNLLGPFDFVTWIVIIITFIALSVVAWAVEFICDSRSSNVKPSPVAGIVFAPLNVLGWGDRKMRSWGGVLIQFSVTFSMIMVLCIYTGKCVCTE